MWSWKLKILLISFHIEIGTIWLNVGLLFYYHNICQVSNQDKAAVLLFLDYHNYCLLTPGRALTAYSRNSIQDQLGKSVSLWELFRWKWVKGYLEEHGWPQGSSTTDSPTPHGWQLITTDPQCRWQLMKTASLKLLAELGGCLTNWSDGLFSPQQGC